jgi:hypothetical protein
LGREQRARARANAATASTHRAMGLVAAGKG